MTILPRRYGVRHTRTDHPPVIEAVYTDPARAWAMATRQEPAPGHAWSVVELTGKPRQSCEDRSGSDMAPDMELPAYGRRVDQKRK